MYKRDDSKRIKPFWIRMSTPLVTTYPRGIKGLGEMSSIISVRLSWADRQLIVEMSKRLGVAQTEFIRWMAAHGADEIRKVLNGEKEPLDGPGFD